MCTCVTECWIHFLVIGFPPDVCTYNTTIDYRSDDGLADDVENGITGNPLCFKGLCKVGLTAHVFIIVICQEVVLHTFRFSDLPMELTLSSFYPNQLACMTAAQP